MKMSSTAAFVCAVVAVANAAPATAADPAAATPTARNADSGKMRCDGPYAPPGIYGTYRSAVAYVPAVTPSGLDAVRRKAELALLNKFCSAGKGCEELRPHATFWDWGQNHGQFCAAYVLDAEAHRKWEQGQTDATLSKRLLAAVQMLLKGGRQGVTVGLRPPVDTSRRNAAAGARNLFFARRIEVAIQEAGRTPSSLSDTRPGPLQPGYGAVIDAHTADVAQNNRRGVELYLCATVKAGARKTKRCVARPIFVRASILPDPPPLQPREPIAGRLDESLKVWVGLPGAGRNLCTGDEVKVTLVNKKRLHVRVLSLYGDEADGGALVIYAPGPRLSRSPLVKNFGPFAVMPYKAGMLETVVVVAASNPADLGRYGSLTEGCALPKAWAQELHRDPYRATPSKARIATSTYVIHRGAPCQPPTARQTAETIAAIGQYPLCKPR